jgi:hypothetical protein
MAKLPQIQYRQVSLPTQPGPGAAVAEASQISQGTRMITEGLTRINEMTREFNTEAATVDAGNQMSLWERENAGREVWTAQEVKDAGLEDQVNMYQGTDEDGNPIPREFIPKHEVYPLAQQREIESAINSSGNIITNNSDRKKWSGDMTARGNEVSTQSYIKAQADAISWTHKEQEVKIVEAQASGNFEGADRLIDARYTNPGLKAEAKQANAVMEEEYNIMMFSQEATPDQLDEQATLMRTPEYLAKSPMDSKQLLAKANTMESLAGVRRNQAKTMKTEAYNRSVDSYWQANYRNPDALLANMPAHFKDEDIRSVVSFAKTTAGGGTVKTNIATWSMLDDMKRDSPDTFRETNLLQYADKLSTTNYQQMKTEQNELKSQFEGKGDPEGYATNQQVINTGLVNLDINPTGVSGQKRRVLMTTIFASALENEAAARSQKGLPAMNTEEKEAVINGVVGVQIQTYTGNLIQIAPWEDLDDEEDISRVSQGIRNLNEPVTAINADAYVELENKNIPLTLENLQIARELKRNHQIVTTGSVQALKEKLQNAQLR